MPEHTPTPWKLLGPLQLVHTWSFEENGPGAECQESIGVMVGDTHGVCLVLAEDPMRQDVEADKLWADALRIVRCVNSHDALLEACRHAAMSHHHPACPAPKKAGRGCTCHVEKARAAIARAEGDNA